jgi:hypothetical protein
VNHAGVYVILVGAALIAWWGIYRGLIEVRRTALIRRDGLSAVGSVTQTRHRTIGDVQQRATFPYVVVGKVVHLEAFISFTTADGQIIQFWCDLDGDDAPKPRSASYEVRYLAENPLVHRFTTPRLTAAWVYMFFFGLFPGGAALWLGIWMLTRPNLGS